MIGVTGIAFSGNKSVLVSDFTERGFDVIDTDSVDVNNMHLKKFEDYGRRFDIVGVTGPSGAGKTAFCRRISALGFDIVDCDMHARCVLDSSTYLKKCLVEVFGIEVLDDKNKINREVVKNLVTKSKRALSVFNRLIFREVASEIVLKVGKSVAAGRKVVIDAPLLFEYKLDTICDKVIVLLYNGSRSRWGQSLRCW